MESRLLKKVFAAGEKTMCSKKYNLKAEVGQ